MRKALLLVTAVAAWTLCAGVAVAQQPSLEADRASVPAGGTVSYSGTCDSDTSGFVLSEAFATSPGAEFAGVGAAPFTTDAIGRFQATATIPPGRAPGTYEVTARCGGGNLGVSLDLRVTREELPFTGARPVFWLDTGVALLAGGALLLAISRGGSWRQ